MKLYLTREQALRAYPIKEDELDRLVETDKLDAIWLNDDGKLLLAIYDDSLAEYVAERDITPDKFDHLRGNLLGVGEAARKYKKSPGALSHWIKQDNLKIQGYDKNKKLVDEADVAYLVTLGKAKKIRPGKKVFS